MRRVGTMAAAVLLAGCAGGGTMSETVTSIFDANPDDVAQVCTTVARGASSRGDLIGMLERMDASERTDLQAGLAQSAGDGIPVEAAAWSWDDVVAFYGETWNECDARGLLD